MTLANLVKVEKKIEHRGYSVNKLQVHALTIKYFVSTWFIWLATYYIYIMTSAKF